MKNNKNPSLPPAIRVFLSSTFSDMENERTYFNQTIVPQLVQMCKERGVSFFSVDLRWGITEEESENGEVLSICLHEIDKCRPFFIGIIGNRYGTVVEKISDDMARNMPWLADKAGHSITELEMLYGVLDKEINASSPNCAFYFRSDKLTKQLYGKQKREVHAKKLAALKHTIQRNKNLSSFEYKNLKEFEKRVISDFSVWLDETFPKGGDVREIRNQWYSSELKRNYVAVFGTEDFLNSYFKSSHHALMVYGEGRRGKTTLLNNWEPQNGLKILINCGADKRFQYWPEIAHEIIRQLNKLDESVGYPELKPSASILLSLAHMFKNRDKHDNDDDGEHFYVTHRELEDFRKSFCKWLREINIPNEIHIVINDLDLLSDPVSRYLSWLPGDLPDNIQLICSTNDDQMVETVRHLDWNVYEMPLFSKENADQFFDAHLKSYGKGMSDEQKKNITSGKLSRYPGSLKFIADFLILHGRYSTIQTLTDAISSIESTALLYDYIISYMSSSLTDKERLILSSVFSLLYANGNNLLESECLQLISEEHDVNSLEWANIRLVLEPLGIISGDYWCLRNKELSHYIHNTIEPENIERAHSILATHNLKLLNFNSKDQDSAITTIRRNIERARSAVYHTKESHNYQNLADMLLNPVIINTLADLNLSDMRAAWIAVIFNSDFEVGSALLDLLRKLHKESDNSKNDLSQVEYVIITLINDLDLVDAREQLPAIFGQSAYYSDLSSTNSSELSEAFISWLRKFNGLPDSKALSEKLAESGLNSYEKCFLIEIKASRELKLKRISNCMELSNEYYDLALEIASMNYLSSAMMLRMECLYHLGKYDAVFELYPSTKMIAEAIGNLRMILSGENIYALNCYHMGESQKAMEVYAQIVQKWRRIGNRKEAFAVQLNQASALIDLNKYDEAYSILSTILNETLNSDQDNLRELSISIEGNLGALCSKMKKTEEAYTRLTNTIEKAETAGLEHTQIVALNNLAQLYSDSQKFEQSADTYERVMHIHLQRGEIDALAVALHQCLAMLRRIGYKKRSDELYEKWSAEFDKIPNGRALLDLKLDHKEIDNRNIHQLEEEIGVARSANDVPLQATLTENLGHTLCDENLYDDGILKLFEAYDLYCFCGNTEKANRCINSALSRLMSGILSDSDKLISATLERIKNPSDAEVINLWKQLHYGQEEPDSEKTVKLLLKVSEYATASPYCSIYCIAGSANKMIELCSEAEINQIIDTFENSVHFDIFKAKILRYFEVNDPSLNLIMKLKDDYTSVAAASRLEHLEKCITILNRMGSVNAAALAGNVALIYRRRRDEEKTFKFHNISSTIYRNANDTHNYLIERLNLATAYMQFNQKQQAIEILRQSLKESMDANNKALAGSIAGNLAQMLMREKDVQTHKDEIVRCYDIEESMFRELGIHRDLIISLVNQAMFYGDVLDGRIDVCQLKLCEAKELAEKYKFDEFMSAINHIERTVNARKAVGKNTQNTPKSEFTEILKSLYDGSELFEIAKFNGEQSVLCLPLKDLPTVAINLNSELAKTGDEWILNLLFLLQPKLGHDKSDIMTVQYADRFSAEGYYPLKYDEEDKVLISQVIIQDKSLDALRSKLELQCKLWFADALNVSMFSISNIDVDEMLQIKLDMMQKLQSENN